LNHRDTENTEKKKTEKRKEGEEARKGKKCRSPGYYSFFSPLVFSSFPLGVLCDSVVSSF